MNRIDRVFGKLRRESRGALIPFLMAGDPDAETACLVAGAVIGAGADILELGVPFSDPVADGPVIQRAGQRALSAGTDIPAVLDLARRIRERHAVPLVLMTYYNPVFKRGEDRFIGEASAAGADGLIVVDLPPEEGRGFFRRAHRAGLATVLMTSPTTPAAREEMILDEASGFVYCVSRLGTTGAREDLPQGLREKVVGLKALTDLPVAVGFGLSRPEQVAKVLSFADGAVIGSALVAAVEKGRDAADKAHLAASFIGGLRSTSG